MGWGSTTPFLSIFQEDDTKQQPVFMFKLVSKEGIGTWMWQRSWCVDSTWNSSHHADDLEMEMACLSDFPAFPGQAASSRPFLHSRNTAWPQGMAYDTVAGEQNWTRLKICISSLERILNGSVARQLSNGFWGWKESTCAILGIEK